MQNLNTFSKEKYLIGLDIGGTFCKFGLFNSSMKIIKKWKIKTNLDDNGQNIILNIFNSIKDNTKEQIKGIGMTVPGVCLSNGMDVTSVNLGWKNKNILDLMHSFSEIPIVIGNDGQLAAMGELFARKEQPLKNLVMITLGTGIGGGIIINNEIVEGGEFSHVTINLQEKINCSCGRSGCLEQYVSGPGLKKAAKDAGLGDILPSEIFKRARNKSPKELKIVNNFASSLGLFLSNLALIIKPEIFVIGGGISEEGEFLIDLVTSYYKKYAFIDICDTHIELSILKNDAGITGAVNYLLKNHPDILT